MSVTFSTGVDEHEPLIVTGYTARRSTRTIVHQLLESDQAAITRRPASLRTGTLRAQFPSVAAATAFYDDLVDVVTFTMNDPDLPSWDMTFVPVDEVELEVNQPDRIKWWVQFDYQEISA